MTIPRILHTSLPREVPLDWSLFLTGKQELLEGWSSMIYQDPLPPAAFELGDLFVRCTTGAQLAGLVRLEQLWRWGGVYLDADVELLRPLDDLLAHPLFICTEDGVHLTDAVIGAEPEHPGIRACMDRARQILEADGPHPTAQATGPLNTTAVLTGRDDVTVLARRAFYPYSYLEPERRLEDFRTTSPDSYGVHHWSFSWKGDGLPQAAPEAPRPTVVDLMAALETSVAEAKAARTNHQPKETQP